MSWRDQLEGRLADPAFAEAYYERLAIMQADNAMEAERQAFQSTERVFLVAPVVSGQSELFYLPQKPATGTA